MLLDIRKRLEVKNAHFSFDLDYISNCINCHSFEFVAIGKNE